MTNKYKLLKELPSVKPGAIITPMYHQMHKGFMILNTQYHIPNSQYTFSKKQLENNPDWFTPFLFTSNDNIDVYKGDVYWYVLNNEIFSNKFREHTDEEHIICFVTKENAEQYLETIKPKFKIGDIVVSETNIYGEVFVGKLVDLTPVTLLNADDTVITFLKKEINRKATNEEIIKYYEQQGWVKGVKFKYYDKVYELYKLSVEDTEVWVNSNFTTIDTCELIKSPNYPKSWYELDYIDQKANSEVLSAQELASLRLRDLHRVLIKEYNKNNNCNWKPDWSNPFATNWIVARILNELQIADADSFYHSLTFPNQELAEFALENWRDLWEYYYELKQ